MKCRKNTESKNPKVTKTIKEILKILSKYAVSNSKKLRFIKEQEESGSFSSLEIKTPLNKYSSIKWYFILKM